MDNSLSYTVKIDMNHLLSKEQIEIVKSLTRCGDEISFRKNAEDIDGIVDRKYGHLFMLKDGRCFTWVDYITGSEMIMDYLHMFHPIERLENDYSMNHYRAKMARVE